MHAVGKYFIERVAKGKRFESFRWFRLQGWEGPTRTNH